MDELTKNLSSPYWWIGVVVVGILINLASAYLKPALDRWLSRMSVWWRNQSAKRKARYEKEIEALMGSAELQRNYEHAELKCSLQALFGIGFAILLLLFKVIALVVPELSIARDLGVSVERANAIFYVFFSVVLLISFRQFIEADLIAGRVAEARRRQRTSNDNAL